MMSEEELMDVSMQLMDETDYLDIDNEMDDRDMMDMGIDLSFEAFLTDNAEHFCLTSSPYWAENVKINLSQIPDRDTHYLA